MELGTTHDTANNTAIRGTVNEVLAGCRRVERSFGDEDIAAVAEHDRQLLTPTTSRKSCVSKRRVGHRTARRDARSLREQGERVHAYACNRCGGWHVGHEPVAHVSAPLRSDLDLAA